MSKSQINTEDHWTSKSLHELIVHTQQALEMTCCEERIFIEKLEEGTAVCRILCQGDESKDSWVLTLTHMRDRYDNHPMLRVKVEGRSMFYASADPDVLQAIVSP